MKNTKYDIRPASVEKSSLFYTQSPEQDGELGCIGHIRMDFGGRGKEFWCAWHPCGLEALNSGRMPLPYQI